MRPLQVFLEEMKKQNNPKIFNQMTYKQHEGIFINILALGTW